MTDSEVSAADAAMKAKFAEADLGVAFRSTYGMNQDEWIAQEVASGRALSSARHAARKMADAALVSRRLREQERQMALGRAYSHAGERNKESSDE